MSIEVLRNKFKKRQSLSDLRSKFNERRKEKEQCDISGTTMYEEEHRSKGHNVLIASNAVHCFTCKTTIYRLVV